jgi:nitrate/TMAO reductase-like tetraheme cytochrome c subunit
MADEPNSGSSEPAGAATTVTPPHPWWQRLLGVRRRQGRFLRWRLTLWGKIVFVGVLLMGAMAGFAEYSMQPDFCRGCHIMEPYYQAWHQSSHKNVPCTDCHFLPGVGNTLYGKFQASSQAIKYITKTYGSKPHAEIRDESCLREGCHEKRLLQGKVNWTVQTTTGQSITIRYDHTPHLQLQRRGMQLRCVSCHSQIVQGRHIVVTTDTCFLCHFKGLKHGRDDQTVGTCKGCHDAPKDVIRLSTGSFNHSDYVGRGVKCENCHADVVQGEGNVPRQVCWNCHNQMAQIAQYGETKLMHDQHVTEHKVECSGCHVQIEHLLPDAKAQTMAAAHGTSQLDNGSCGLCHEQTHMGPREMFFGVGARGVPDMPSPMARVRVQCIACHTVKSQVGEAALVTGQTYVAAQDRCNYCHGQKYPTALADWKQVLDEKQARADAALEEASKAVAGAQLAPEPKLQAQRLLDDAAYNVKYVKLAHGLHNIVYATACLSVAEEKCRQAEAIASGKVASAK